MEIQWEHSPTPGIRRGKCVVPPFDCGPKGRDCKHEKKGAHGRHCSEWYFYVAMEGFGMSLCVFVGDYPGDPEGLHKTPRGSVMAYHQATIKPEENYLPHAEYCPVIDAPCYFGSGYLIADEFYQEHGHSSYEETEEFWQALEERLKAWKAEVLDS